MNSLFNRKSILSLLLILLGNFLVAFGIAAFIIPCDLISGGSTGVALLIHHMTGLRVSEVVLVLNAAFFAFGYFLLGKSFAMGTLLSNFIYPFFLRVLENQPLLQGLTDDRMLSTVLGGLLVGLGVGTVFKAGASTGGTDPIPLVLHKYLQLPLSAAVYAVDFVIVMAQAFFSDSEAILYGIIFVIASSVMIDKVSMLGEAKVQVLTISQDSRSICDAILHDCNMGATLINIETGYNGQPQTAVMTVTHKRCLSQLQNTITGIDPAAFIQITNIASVHGRGFTLER